VRAGRKHLKDFLTPPVILLAIMGSVADGCDLDVYMNLCAAENDEDEVSREDSGHHESDKQRRKSLVRLPIWPASAERTKCSLALDEAHPSIRKGSEERAIAASPSASPDCSLAEHEGNGGVLRLTASRVTRRSSPVPSLLRTA
jgi:hypothetical protein